MGAEVAVTQGIFPNAVSMDLHTDQIPDKKVKTPHRESPKKLCSREEGVKEDMGAGG